MKILFLNKIIYLEVLIMKLIIAYQFKIMNHLYKINLRKIQMNNKHVLFKNKKRIIYNLLCSKR